MLSTNRYAAGYQEVTVGINATCIYGLATCYAGARGALSRLPGVREVLHRADNRYSVAYLFVDNNYLPDVARWQVEFVQATNGSYGWRGVEMTLIGTVQSDGAGGLTLAAAAKHQAVTLLPLQWEDKVQLDLENGVPRPLPAEEANSFAELARRIEAGGSVSSVTGPIKLTSSGFVLEVREFKP